MAVFLGVHDMGGEATDEMMKGAWERYKDSAKKLGAEGHKAFYNAKKGRAYCITEAESEQVVQQAHDDAGVPVNEIIEVQKMR